MLNVECSIVIVREQLNKIINAIRPFTEERNKKV